MQTLPLEGEAHAHVLHALGASPLFSSLAPEVRSQVAARATLHRADVEDVVMHEGDPSDSFFLVVTGEVSVRVRPQSGEDPVEVTRLPAPEIVGEVGLLLRQPRSASILAAERSLLLRFDEPAFHVMYERIPGFALAVSRSLALRLASSARQLPMPAAECPDDIDAETLALLPVEFMERHRVVPVRQTGHELVLGCVEDANPRVLGMVRELLLPGMVLRPKRISAKFFERALSGIAGVEGWSSRSRPSPAAPPAAMAELVLTPAVPEELALELVPEAAEPAPGGGSPRLDALLRRLVAEGGSDLHISGSQRPRWRVDGEMREIADVPPLGPNEVKELLEPVMDGRSKKAFHEDHDADFAYAIDGLARFRVNLFRDKGGVGAVMRVIPAKILTFEQLNLPPVCQKMCENPKGLVLVTGPTGSGKSTTLAAMIDSINKNRRSHIITLEDPIEFVHMSRGCMINQREVGPHTKSFHRALKAALREDPDIVLVGEMRNLETVSLALETANTGHLVFGTLHTATAISTVDRIIDLFPAEQQNQVRSALADTLKGVVAQNLCKKIGGGRVAALEILVSTVAMANLIREGKTHQMASAMSTSRAQGNVLLNDALAQLVADNKVDFNEALTKSLDKADLAKRCGKPLPPELGGPPVQPPPTITGGAMRGGFRGAPG